MDLEVVGRHALFFDDDASAAFVNSGDALVEWNSLSIDRYDVRHLLPNPLPPLKRRRSSMSPPPDRSLEPELDHERYLNLPPPHSDEEEVNDGLKTEDNAAYHSVGFFYENADDSNDKKNLDAGLESAGFRPPFPVPESLRQNLPPSEKVHQIMSRTATFVNKHGGQSEIVLRVKHGNNPTFGFLMPDHHLHPYFRFLVDDKKFLRLDLDDKIQEVRSDDAGGGGALSLLGSVYGSGEDEDSAVGDGSVSIENKSAETIAVYKSTISDGIVQTDLSVSEASKEISKHILPSKDKTSLSKSNGFNNVSKVGKIGDSLGPPAVLVKKPQALSSPGITLDASILEPPADVKRVIDKIVEFILKNGRNLEAVLVEQDNKHGRFPFLLPLNKYHSYYLKVLQKAQESKLIGKTDDSEVYRAGKKDDSVSPGSADLDIPYDDRKERFKMIIGKSKKDGQEQLSKANNQQFGVNVDATAAAAILQAATRGIKHSKLEFFPKTSLNASSHGLSSEGGEASSLGALVSSQLQSIGLKPEENGEAGMSVPVAKVIAKTAAIAAASEADSTEAGLTREQKVKAERLKRAKMFAAIIRSGAGPLETKTSAGLSDEPPEAGGSGSTPLLMNVFGEEREGSSAPPDDMHDKVGMIKRKCTDDEYNKRRLKRKYRSRSKRHEEDDDDDDDDDGENEGKEEKERRHRRHFTSKKSQSHRSSHHSKDRHSHRKIHSSSKDRDFWHGRKYSKSSPDDGDEKRSKHRKRSHFERKVDLEEGEISTKCSDQSKASLGDGASGEASPDISHTAQDGRTTPQSSKVSEVSDDLRAKVRAMLLATL